MAEHVTNRGVDGEYFFACCVLQTLRTRDVILDTVTTRTRKMSHKHRTEVDASEKNVHENDRKNSNEFFRN